MSTPELIAAGASAGLLATPVLLVLGHRFETAAAPHGRRPALTVAAATTAACSGAAAAVQPTVPAVAFYGLFLAVSTAASCTDLAERRLPDRLTYPLIAAGITTSLTSWWLHWPGNGTGGLLGGLIYSGWLLLCTLLVRAGAGYGLGDIKLALALGLLTGTHSSLAVAGTILAGQLLTILSMLVLRARGIRTHVPLGPALTAGAALGILYATTVLS